jgi:hypothetical protein
LRRVGSGQRFTFVFQERDLSAWMADNAFVSWVVSDTPWLLEHVLLASLDVPLNLDGNGRHAFHATLTSLRAAAVRRARELPVVANPGMGGRWA